MKKYSVYMAELYATDFAPQKSLVWNDQDNDSISVF